MLRSRKFPLVGLAPACLLTGCAVGPDFHAPAAPHVPATALFASSSLTAPSSTSPGAAARTLSVGCHGQQAREGRRVYL